MRDLTRDEVTEAASLAVGDRVRTPVKAVLEQILDEEMAEHVDFPLGANADPHGRAQRLLRPQPDNSCRQD
jgi:hypothetical protein